MNNVGSDPSSGPTDAYPAWDAPPSNLAMGVVGGIIGLLIGALLWSIISVLLDAQIGYMAIGVGFLVGMGMWLLGKGTTPTFGIVGAALAFVGVILGNALTATLLVSREFGVSVTEVMSVIDWGELIGEILRLSEPIDWLFYALAVYAGFRFSYRQRPAQATG